jgi:hypothetical protein
MIRHKGLNIPERKEELGNQSVNVKHQDERPSTREQDIGHKKLYILEREAEFSNQTDNV